MRTSHLRWLTLYTGCMLSMAGMAAPTSETPTVLPLNAVHTVPLGNGASARPGNQGSDTRTIDLLVEMQQPVAGIQFNERGSRKTGREGSARTPPEVRSTHQPQIEAPLTPPSGLFGSGAPAVQVRAQHVVDRPSSGDATLARASGRPSSDVPTELKRWLQWPHAAIAYVRENRGFVVGGTAMLLLMGWTGSMMFSRRRG